jgi:hypothetical protein
MKRRRETVTPIIDVQRPVTVVKKSRLQRLRVPLKKVPLQNLWSNPVIVALGSAGITLLIILVVLQTHRTHSPTSQVSQVLDEVGKIMYLPQDETPALAIVADQSKLQGSLKAVAKVGDDILIYQKHSEAIVYRPSVHKIVAVEPVLIGQQPNPAFTVTVAVLNGSGNNNATQQFIAGLYRLYPNVDLVYKDTAPRLFPTTIVFGGQLGDPVAEEVAKSLNIQAGQAPLGVSSGLATLTFIIGQDYKP